MRSQFSRFTRLLAFLAVVSVLAPFVRAEALPNPKTGGSGGGPVTMLFFSAPGSEPDKVYVKELADQGYVVTTANFYEPLKYEFFKQFNLIVMDALPPAGQQWETFGQKMIYYRTNHEHVVRCLNEGAGLLVYAYTAGGGGFGGWNDEMQPFGVQIIRGTIRDPQRGFAKWQAYGENMYSWTEALEKHPVTAGLKRIYYPSANLRWDEFYTAPPLILDKNWTPLVKAMPGAHAEREAGNKWSMAHDEPKELVLAAVRAVGKGRLGVVSCEPAYIHQFPYLKSNTVGELSYAPKTGIDGAILKNGDGTVKSDTGALISNLYACLGANSTAGGLGGFKPGSNLASYKEPLIVSPEEKNFTRVIDWDHPPTPPSWRHRATLVTQDGVTYAPEVSDPLVHGEIKYFKALVGAHTALSDGKGTVAEFAAAARKAGYSLICFAEAFEALSAANFSKLQSDCKANTTDDFACLPGYDIMDRDGNHLIVIAAPEYPHSAWLTPDGKRVEQVQMLNLGYYNHKVVAHKPVSSKVLPFERLKHFQGLSVYTYRNGKLVDDSLKAYAWESENGSTPQPIVVHEVLSPAEVERAATTGFQQVMPADTLANAVSYFRIGLSTFFEAPPRYLISEGPVIDRWVVAGSKDVGPGDPVQQAKENRQHFRIVIGAHSDVPLKEVTLFDGPTPVRHWLPTGNEFAASADFQHSHQYGLYVIVEDSKGRRAISSPVRTVADRYEFRCSDRQNWIGHTGWHYPGTNLPEHLEIAMPIKGTDEGSAILTNTRGTVMAVKLNFPLTSNDVVLTEALLDDVYTNALWDDIGYDAKPSWASKPSTVYGGRLRHWNFTPGIEGKAYVTLIEIELKLKRDVEPVANRPLWPAFSGLREKKFCRLGPDGKLVVGDIKEDLDVTPGTLAGGFIGMSPGLRVASGMFGMTMPTPSGTTIPAGTPITARFLIAGAARSFGAPKTPGFDSDAEGYLRAMGFAGPTPYSIELSRGKLNKIEFIADVTPDRGGAAGYVAKAAQIPYWVPLGLHGLNPNWVAGIWQEGQAIRYAGVFEKAAWPRLDVSRGSKFYAGNLLTADNVDLVLEPIVWTKDRIKVEVHNPTSAPIVATVSSPKEIEGFRPLSAKATVPAGSTVYLESR